MPEKLISDLIVVPERVRKGDFVLNLSKGVSEPEKTLEEYVVASQLAASFDDALGFIKSAVDAANSKACYLHGSFGAGKSHFMAVLHLLLQHIPAVTSIKELAPVSGRQDKATDHRWRKADLSRDGALARAHPASVNRYRTSRPPVNVCITSMSPARASSR
jgi:hypothetical protein